MAIQSYGNYYEVIIKVLCLEQNNVKMVEMPTNDFHASLLEIVEKALVHFKQTVKIL